MLAHGLSGSEGPAASPSSGAPATAVCAQKVKRTLITLTQPHAPPAAKFRVLQWNILADGLAQNGDFVKVPADCLEWEYRRRLVLEELLEAGADVICLQECNHYEEILTYLEPLGYAGAFHAKVCSPAERYKCPPDGMAMFYNRKRFTPVGSAKGYTFLDDQGHKQSQGFLQVMLHDNVIGRDVLVVTTHLKAKEASECEMVRVKQVRQMLRSVSNALATWTPQQPGCSNGNGNGNGSSSSGANGNGQHASAAAAANGSLQSTLGTTSDASIDDLAAACPVPVILAGDFNTEPLSETCWALRGHALRLRSMWDDPPLEQPPPPAPGPGPAPEFSTWKYRSKGESKRVIDYIWYTAPSGAGGGGGAAGALRALRRWRMLTEEEVGPAALPSRAYASDHIALCCDFEWDLPHLDWAPPGAAGTDAHGHDDW